MCNPRESGFFGCSVVFARKRSETNTFYSNRTKTPSVVSVAEILPKMKKNPQAGSKGFLGNGCNNGAKSSV